MVVKTDLRKIFKEEMKYSPEYIGDGKTNGPIFEIDQSIKKLSEMKGPHLRANREEESKVLQEHLRQLLLINKSLEEKTSKESNIEKLQAIKKLEKVQKLLTKNVENDYSKNLIKQTVAAFSARVIGGQHLEKILNKKKGPGEKSHIERLQQEGKSSGKGGVYGR